MALWGAGRRIAGEVLQENAREDGNTEKQTGDPLQRAESELKNESTCTFSDM